MDVQDATGLDASIADIAAENQRLDGLVAAAGVQHVSSAVDYPSEKIGEVLKPARNLTGTPADLHR